MSSPYTFVYLLGFVVAVVAATALAIAMAPQPAKRWIVASTVMTALWTLSDLLANLSTSPRQMEQFAHAFCASWAFLPWLWFRATAHYTGHRRLVGWKAGALLAAPGVGFVLLALTNRLHSAWVPAGEGGHFHVVAAPWSYALGPYFLAYSLLCAGILASAEARERIPAFRASVRMFAVVIPVAIVPGTLLNGGLSGLSGLADLPMLGSLFTCVVAGFVAVGVLRQSFFAPVARLQRWAEDTVRASEGRYRTLLETSPDGVLVLGPAGEITAANSCACAMWGHASAADLIRERRTACELLAPEDAPHAREAARRVLGEGARRGLGLCGRRADGSTFPLEVSLGVLTGPAGEPVGFVCTAHDVSERVAAERERRALQEQALHGQKVESLGMLAGGIAHDFNNVLVGVIGNASLALRTLPAGAPERELLQTIVEAGDAGSLLTRQLLTYAGRGRAEVEAVDLSAAASSMARLLGVSAPKAVEWEFELQDGLEPVAADPGQLQQVVLNLVANASEAMEGRPGRIRIATRRLQSSGRDQLDHAGAPVPAGTYGVLEVCDNGCGIGPEARGVIFDPFYTTKPKGRGLGLAAVLGIVRGHGGAIQLESERGMGTTMRVLLPLAPPGLARRAPEAPAAGPVAPRFAGQAVVVADDEPVVRQVMVATLEQAGLRALQASNGAEAVEALRAAGVGNVAAAILDVDMPVMDGRRAAVELRALQPDLPIVWVTGRCAAETLEALQATPASTVVPKPFAPQTLLARLASTLGGAGGK